MSNLNSALKFAAYFFLIFELSGCKKEVTGDSNSQSPINYYTGGGKDKVNTIEKTSGNGFIYCGSTGQDSARTDAFLMKVDGDGNQEWYKTYGGKYYDEFKHVIQTSDGGFIAVGQTNSMGFGTLDRTYKYADYVVKLNSSGVVEWSKSYLNGQGCLTNVYETPDHFYLITGYYYPVTYDVVILKIDQSGAVSFGRSYPTLSSYPPNFIKNNYNEMGQCISLANDGSIIVGGVMSKSNLLLEAQDHVTFIMKTNPTGFVQYLNPIYDFVRGAAYRTGFNELQNRFATVKMINLSDGYLIGTYLEELGTGILEIQLLKTDLSGTVLWHKEYRGLGNALLYNMELTDDGNILMIGASSKLHLSWQFPEMFYNLKTMIMKVDMDGKEFWTRYTGSDQNTSFSKCVQPLTGGGWRIAGYTTYNESNLDKMWSMKVNENGQLMNEK